MKDYIPQQEKNIIVFFQFDNYWIRRVSWAIRRDSYEDYNIWNNEDEEYEEYTDFSVFFTNKNIKIVDFLDVVKRRKI